VKTPDPTTPELAESRLYTFIDESREFALYFLEGQKLIHDLALLHGIYGMGFAYWRDVVLSIQPMIGLLKHGEQLGFYIDSEDPWFRLKIETSHNGWVRSVLIPEDFKEFPSAMRGQVRVQKLFPNNQPPYQSVLEVAGEPLRAIVNHVLRVSYQLNAAIVVSPHSDQSLMLHQLPPIHSDEYDYSLDAVRSRRGELESRVETIFKDAFMDESELVPAFADLGFRLLAGRDVLFHCSCDKQRMVEGLQLACGDDIDGLFDPGSDWIEITCEYCKSRYEISRDELRQTPNTLN